MSATDLSSGKGHGDENFPVASALIAARHRPVVMAFYKVARMADDIADHASAPAAEKLERLAAIEASLTGESDSIAEAAHLRRMLEARAITSQHMLDLLEAFRRDVTKTRYVDWAQLMDYCRYSAAPVGRFMLDVHGESRATWPASDALCAALQVINHLQDCGEDYRTINRVYVPLDALAAADLTVECLAGPARRDRRSGAAHGRPAGSVARTGAQGARYAAVAGDRRDSSPGGEPRAPADRARSAIGACASPAPRSPRRRSVRRRRRDDRPA